MVRYFRRWWVDEEGKKRIARIVKEANAARETARATIREPDLLDARLAEIKERQVLLTKKARRWSKKTTIIFKDLAGDVHRLEGFTDDRVTQSFCTNLEHLIDRASCGEALDADLVRWVQKLPAETRKLLAEVHLLDAGRAAGARALVDQVEEFRAALVAKGATAAHAQLTANRAKAVVEGCGFKGYADVSPAKVLSYLAGIRSEHFAGGRKRKGVGLQSSNWYLQAVKGFCKWMIRERRATDNPIAHLEGFNVRVDRRHDRRALTLDECRRLIGTTQKSGKTILQMAGSERSLLYRFALETGLRWNELRTLKCGNFTLAGDAPTVTVEAAYSKHRREDRQPLRRETAALLADYLAGSDARAPAFGMGSACNKAVRMIQADRLAARTAWLREALPDVDELKRRAKTDFLRYKDAAGRVMDFHALRHTFITNLCAAGVHPKVAQALARHSTISLTMDRYTHLSVDRAADGLMALPSLDAPKAEAAEIRKTGTDDVALVKAPAPAGTTARFLQRDRIFTAISGHSGTQNGDSERELETSGIGAKTLENPRVSTRSELEAAPGFEPGMTVLQTVAFIHLATPPRADRTAE